MPIAIIYGITCCAVLIGYRNILSGKTMYHNSDIQHLVMSELFISNENGLPINFRPMC